MKCICTRLLVILTLLSVTTVTTGVATVQAAGERARFSDYSKRPVNTAAGEPDAGQTGRGSATPPPDINMSRRWVGGGRLIPWRWTSLVWLSRTMRLGN